MGEFSATAPPMMSTARRLLGRTAGRTVSVRAKSLPDPAGKRSATTTVPLTVSFVRPAISPWAAFREARRALADGHTPQVRGDAEREPLSLAPCADCVDQA
ncbi:hypothetical protein BKH20_07115 [Actinomyces oris]|uniref:Uncharacterized protein n=1 Tax=Actinomyces oris TaxID=544580 RepID=A0A1Q8WP84_9ACTO|nr:hypothetical protein BKH20_07115 [Actinomyces oris]